MDLTQDTAAIPAGGASTQGIATPNDNGASDQMQIDDSYEPTVIACGRITTRAGGRGRGRGTRGRGRGSTAKRPRARRDADGPNDEDCDDDKNPKTTKKRKSNAPEPPGVYPVEIHRRKTSLRERLISGEFEPQAVGMRAHNLKKAAAAAAAAAPRARNIPREFLIPIGPRLNASAHNQLPSSTNNTANIDNAGDIQPNLRIAYKSTPIHQLHFSEGLVLSLKQSMIKWEGRHHSEGLVFVVVHLINSDVVDMHVFSTLHDATTDAIWIMINEHPEVFALPRQVDADGVEVKFERHERATSLIREINNRPNFVQVPIDTTPTNQGHGNGNASGSVTRTERGDTVFVMNKENSDTPRPTRLASPQLDLNDRGELLLGDAPEPAYVFCGKYRIVSFGLKMEACRADGAVVKVSVHLKNLRRPAPV